MGLRKTLLQLLRDTSATSAIEYAFIGSLIFVAIIGVVGSVGNEVDDLWEYVRQNVETPKTP